MYIIVNGGGKVGSFLAKMLKEKKHDVVVIEKREDICQMIANEVLDVLVVNGDGCDIKYLEEAGCGHADIFASVTGDDDDNLVACQLAKASFDVPRAIARVNNPKNESIFHELKIEAVSSTTIISRLIEEEATIGDIFTLHVLKKGRLALVEVDLPVDRCKACNKKIAELGMPSDCILVTIIRDDEVIVPSGDTELKAGDSVIAITDVDREQKLKDILT